MLSGDPLLKSLEGIMEATKLSTEDRIDLLENQINHQRELIEAHQVTLDEQVVLNKKLRLAMLSAAAMLTDV